MAGKRRGNAEGSITLYKGKDGAPDLWCARLTLPDGRRKAIYGKTRAEVAQKLTKALRDRDQGLRAAGDERQTVGQYLTRWLETVKPTLKQRSYERYEQAIRAHVLPALGGVKLVKLSAHQLQAFYAAKLTAGLSPSTVAHLHAVMHRALHAAERLDLVPRNVADRVTAPRAVRHEMHFFTAEQAQAILEGVAGDRLEALYVLALTTGARQGELLGLQWRTVDLRAGTIRIEQTLHFDKGGTWRLASPKTERSRRTIELPPMAVEALRAHRVRQAEERLAMGAAWNGHGFVFTTTIGTALDGVNLLKAFHRLCDGARLPRIRFHDLRHTAATLLLGRGVNPKIVSEMLGHASVGITLDTYSHVLPTMQQSAAAEMDAALTAERS